MKTRHKFLLAFAGVHLMLVIFGAAQKKLFSPMTPHGSAVSLYSSLSGADNGYGFFAPGVGSQIRTKFKLADKDGNTWTETLDLGATSEANLRFTGLSNLLPTLPEEERERILRSMAATMFGKNPNAETVTVRLDLYGIDRSEIESDFPTMAEYRDGKQPKWLPLMEITYTRSKLNETQMASR